MQMRRFLDSSVLLASASAGTSLTVLMTVAWQEWGSSNLAASALAILGPFPHCHRVSESLVRFYTHTHTCTRVHVEVLIGLALNL